jgi:hypothetical protein
MACGKLHDLHNSVEAYLTPAGSLNTDFCDQTQPCVESRKTIRFYQHEITEIRPLATRTDLAVLIQIAMLGGPLAGRLPSA